MEGTLVRSNGRRLLLVLALVLSLVPPAMAQTQEASIIGQVTDESGGVLPGVTVTATSPAYRSPVTDVLMRPGIGSRRRRNVPCVRACGILALRREAIPLTATVSRRGRRGIEVGTLHGSVTVSGGAPVVDVASTSAPS